MFFVTVKFNRKTAVSIILAVAAILIALVIIFSRSELSEGAFSSKKLSSTEERVTYLESLGWDVDPNSETEKSVLIPREFTGVYLDYNTLQKQQGFDLEKYPGTEVNMFTYIVTNYESADTVVASLYTYKDEVVAGDIHSTTLEGFMHGLK